MDRAHVRATTRANAFAVPEQLCGQDVRDLNFFFFRVPKLAYLCHNLCCCQLELKLEHLRLPSDALPRRCSTVRRSIGHPGTRQTGCTFGSRRCRARCPQLASAPLVQKFWTPRPRHCPALSHPHPSALTHPMSARACRLSQDRTCFEFDGDGRRSVFACPRTPPGLTQGELGRGEEAHLFSRGR